PEIVVKRACPCSSRFIPLGAPIDFSGDFSKVGWSVFSAHCFSDDEGARPSKTAAIGLSATFLGGCLAICFLLDDRRAVDDQQAPAYEDVVSCNCQAFAYFHDTYTACAR